MHTETEPAGPGQSGGRTTGGLAAGTHGSIRHDHHRHACLRGRWPLPFAQPPPRYHLAYRTGCAPPNCCTQRSAACTTACVRLSRADPVGSTRRLLPFFRRLPADNGSLPHNGAYPNTPRGQVCTNVHWETPLTANPWMLQTFLYQLSVMQTYPYKLSPIYSHN